MLVILILKYFRIIFHCLAERLARQLAFIEYHAQTQFSLLKHLPTNVWEKSKTQATNVYMEELKRYMILSS